MSDADLRAAVRDWIRSGAGRVLRMACRMASKRRPAIRTVTLRLYDDGRGPRWYEGRVGGSCLAEFSKRVAEWEVGGIHGDGVGALEGPVNEEFERLCRVFCRVHDHLWWSGDGPSWKFDEAYAEAIGAGRSKADAIIIACGRSGALPGVCLVCRRSLVGCA